MNRARILLADDHRMIAEGLKSLLGTEYHLIATVEDGRALVDAVHQHDPDIVVADISMPRLNGIEALLKLQKAGARAKVIFLTMFMDPSYAVRAFEAGAAGFVLKHAASAELLTAIREVLKGRVYVTPMIAKGMLEYFLKKPSSIEALSGFSPRQREILQLVAEGRSAKEIAAVLGISPRTVEFHKSRIMKALNYHTQFELVQYAIRQGIVSVDPG